MLDEERYWEAVRNRDAWEAGRFYFGVFGAMERWADIAGAWNSRRRCWCGRGAVAVPGATAGLAPNP